MPQKKRLSDDAFSWVKKTEDSNKNDSASEKKTALPVKKTKTVKKEASEKKTVSNVKFPAASEMYSRRMVFVQYRKDGTIVSVAGIAKQYFPENGSPFIETDNLKSAELNVPLEFEKAGILEIHKACIVTSSSGTTLLVRNDADNDI